MTQTPAPRPVACDLGAARELASDIGADVCALAFRESVGHNVTQAEATIDALCDDLAATRAERDAALAALPDAQMLDSYATGIEWEGFEAAGLRKAAAAIRALDAAAPVPAADVAGATS